MIEKMGRSVKLIILFVFTNIFIANAAISTWTGALSTDWNTGGNWSPVGVPPAGNDVLIPGSLTNYPVISDAGHTVKTIEINSSGSGASLTINTGGGLTLTGLITINANGTFTVNDGTVVLVGLDCSGTMNVNGGTITSNSNIILSVSSAVLNQTNGTIWLATNTSNDPSDNLIITAGTVNQSGGTIYTKDFGPIAGTFNQNGSGAVFRIFHDWKPSSGHTFNSTAGTFRVSGDPGAGATYTSTNSQFFNVLIDAGIDPKFGNDPGCTIKVAGNYTDNNTGALSISNAYTINFNGTGAQVITSSRGVNNSFSVLTISNSGNTVSLASNINMNGALTVKAGSTLALSTFNLGSNVAPTNLTMEIGSTGASITGSTGTLTLGGDVTVNTTSGNSGASISANVALGATRTFTIADDGSSATDFSISGVVSGAFGLTKAGAGKMVLSGLNSYTGKTIIGAGTLSINTIQNVSGGSSALGAPTTIANGTIDIAATGILQYTGSGNSSDRVVNLTASGGTIDASGSGTLTLSGGVTGNTFNLNITGTGNATESGVIATTTGTLSKSGTGTWTLSGSNSYTGLTTISAGTIRLGATGGATNTPLGTTGTGTLVSSGGTLDLNGFTLGTSEALTINGTGASGTGAITNTSATNVSYSGLLTLGTSSTITTNNGSINFSNAGTITGATFGLTLDGSQTNASIIAGIIGTTSGTVTKNGVGTWTLSGTNTFTGGTTLNAGTLNINNSQALGTSAGTFTINGGSINNTSGADITTVNYPLALNGNFTYTGSIPRNLNLGAGTTTLNADRQITVTAGTLTVGGTISQITRSLTKAGAGTLSFGSQAVTLNNIIINAGTLSGSASTINPNGDWTNNVSAAAFSPGTSTLIFNNTSSNQNINGTATSQTFNNVTVAKSSTKLNIAGSTTTASISGTLTMTSGNIDAGSNVLELGTSIGTPGTLAYTNGNIIGAFKRWFNSTDAKQFPLGLSSSSGTAIATRNVLVTFTNLTNGSLTGQFFASDPGNSGLPLLDGAVNVDRQFTEGYWSLVSANGLASTNYDLELTGTGFLSYTIDVNTRIIKRSDVPGAWTLNGTHVAASGSTAKRSGLSGFSQFAMGTDFCKSLALSFSQTNVACYNGSTGAIDLSVSGGNSPFTYSWTTSNGTGLIAGNEDQSGLTDGTYDVTVTDNVGCTANTSVTITENTAINISKSQVNVSCNGGSNGSIDLTISGGAPGYTYNWSNGPTTQDVSGLVAATYTVTVTDNVGCTATSITAITQPSSISRSVSVTNVSCNLGNNGAVDLTVTGGTTPYTYAWSTGATTQDLSNRTAGTYTVTITDAQSCTSTISATVTQPSAISIAVDTVSLTCFSSGEIDITVTGGTSPYTYNWADLSGTNNSEDRTGLAAGSYSVTVTDANGCTKVQAVLLGEPDCTNSLMVCQSETAAVFYVEQDPMVDTYTWTVPVGAVITSGQGTSQITVNFIAVTPGDYLVCAKAINICGQSNNTCKLISVRTVSASASTGPTCIGQAIQFSANGGVSYSWSGPGGFTSGSPNPIINNASAAHNGTYTVTATDEEGCTGTATVSVTVNASPSASTLITDSGCGQSIGAVNLTPSGGTPGYTYAWSNGAITQDISGVYAGIYNVTITDANGCVVISNNAVSDIEVNLSVAISDSIECYGNTDGDINLTVLSGTAPFTYLWSNSATTQDLTNVAAGLYSVSVTDNNGCKGNDIITLAQPTQIILDHVQTNVNCFGASTGSINLSVTGGTPGYSYNWSGGQTTQDISGLPAGNYTVTVTDNKSCTSTHVVSISQPSSGVSASLDVTNVLCNGSADGTIIVNTTGGTNPYNYDWADLAGTNNIKDRSGLNTGTYNLTITDDNGCTTTKSQIITQPSALNLSNSKTDVSCNGGTDGSINLSVSNGTSPYTYAWSNSAITQDISGLNAGTYTVTVTDANDCTTTTSVTITQPTVLTANATADSTLCFGSSDGSIDLTVSGGTASYTFLWSNGATTEDVSSISAGNYSVTVTDFKSCTSIASATVLQPVMLDVSASVTNVLCNGASTGAINITASGGTSPYTYDWADIGGTNNSEDRTNLAAGTYTVTITDANNCTVSDSYTIAQPSAISLSMSNTNLTCNGSNDGSILLSVSGGVAPYSYLWNNGATTKDRTGLAIGTHTVTVTDANSCTAALTSAAITQPAVLNISTSATHVFCYGGNNGSITATPSGGTAPYTYEWSTGGTTSTINTLSAGSYTITVTDANNCMATHVRVITQPAEAIQLFASISMASCSGPNGSIDLTVQGGQAAYTYLWSNSSTAQDPSGLVAATYTVTVTDALTCQAVQSFTVNEAAALTSSVTAFNRTCLNANGSAFAVYSGGVAPYTFLWSNGATTQSISNLDVGTYTVTVTEKNGCTSTASGFVGIPSCLPPNANNDSYVTPFNTPIINGTIASNDSDPDHLLSQLIFIALESPTPAEGDIEWDPSFNGTFTYTPTNGYIGSFSILYRVCDPTDLCDTARLFISVGDPQIGVAKRVSSGPTDNGNGSFTFTYRIKVENTGDVTLSNIQVKDTLSLTFAGASSFSVNSLSSSDFAINNLYNGVSDFNLLTGTDNLVVGDSGIILLTLTFFPGANYGPYNNTATARGTSPNSQTVTDYSQTGALVDPDNDGDPTDNNTPTPISFPRIQLTKTGVLNTNVIAPNGIANVGDQINYTFTVCNTGQVTLTDITVSDPMVTVTGGPVASLAPGACDNTTFTGVYTLTQADIDAGEKVNTAIGSGKDQNDQTISDPDTETTSIPKTASINIVKNGVWNDANADLNADAGETISYSFTVTNTGNVTLNNIKVTDPLFAVSGGPITLAPGAVDNSTFSGIYVITQVDVNAGSRQNTATVDAKDPQNADVTDNDTHIENLPQSPGLTVVKTSTTIPNTYDQVGDILTYNITVQNSGNVSISAIVVSDPGADAGSITYVSGDNNNNTILEITETWLYTAQHTVVAGDLTAGFFTNTATANGTPAGGTLTPDSDDETIYATQSITIDDVTVNENDGIATFTVSLSGGIPGGFSVDYVSSDNSAVEPGDYLSTHGTLYFSGLSGETQTFMVPIEDDLIGEPTETYLMDLFNVSSAYVVIADAQGIGTILDNDPVTLALSGFTTTETNGTQTQNFAVALNTSAQEDIVITFTTTNSTALAGSDYTGQTTVSYTIPGGSTSYNIPVDVLGDLFAEPTENFTGTIAITNSNGQQVSITTPTATGIILDDDAVSVSINDVVVNEDDGTATFTVTLTGNIQDQLTVDYLTADNSALQPGDYAMNFGTVLFPAGSTNGATQIITINITDDLIGEPTENYFVDLFNIQSTGSASISDAQGIGLILDNDPVTLSLSGFTTTETNSTQTQIFAVTLNTSAQENIVITFTTTNNTALAGADYTGQTTVSYTIPAGSTTYNIPVDVLGDLFAEPTEDFTGTIAITNANGQQVSITTPTATGIILDDDAVSVSINDVVVNEDDGTATFTVTLTGNIQDQLTVDYLTADDSALQPGDYVMNFGTVLFPAGSTNGTTQFITINITDDLIGEPTENYFVDLFNIQSTGGTSINDAQGIGLILDNDPVTLALSGFTTTETNGTQTQNFAVTLNTAAQEDIVITLTTTNNTALAGSDYTGQTTVSYTITAGSTSYNIPVDVLGDLFAEPTEDFTGTIAITNANGQQVSITTPTATGIILDDDAVSVSINDVVVNEDDGTATFTVTLTGNIQDQLTVDYLTADDSALQPGDYVMNFGTVLFPAGSTNGATQIITINITDDLIGEPTENYFVDLFNIQSTGGASINDAQGIGLILDNDPVTLSLSGFTTTETNGTQTQNFAVILNTPAQEDIVITFTTTNNTALAGSDYTGQTTVSYTIPAGSTANNIPLDVLGDLFAEPTEDFTGTIAITNANSQQVSITTPTATGTILDDDAVSVSIDDVIVNENDGIATFTVTLTGNIQDQLTVDYLTADNSALQPGDYVMNFGTVLFPAGSTNGATQFITINITDDLIGEPTENYFVDLFNIQSTGGTSINDAQGIGLILDNDPVILALSGFTTTETNGTQTQNFAVALNTSAQEDIVITFTTTNNIALAGSDYTGQTTVSYTIPAGSTSYNIPVDVLGDLFAEPTENFTGTIAITNSNGQQVSITTPTATGIILDDDAVSVSINDVVVNEDDGIATFTVTLTGNIQDQLTVDYLTADNSALQPGDYLFNIGTALFPAGSTNGATQIITINITDDLIGEPTENYFVDLFNIQNTGSASISDAQGIGTIIDNDPVTLALSGFTTTETNGTQTQNFAVTLNTPAQEDIVIAFTTTNNTALAGSDYTGQTTVSYTIPAGSTSYNIPIDVLGDLFAEPTEDFNGTIAITNANGQQVSITTPTATGIILDDDAVSVSIDDVIVNENDGNATFTVTLTGNIQDQLTVDYMTGDNSALQPGDYLFNIGTAIFPAGSMNGATQSISINITDDLVGEPTENYFVNLFNIQSTGSASIIDAQGIGVILDNDPVTLSLSGFTTTETNGTQTQNFVVTLNTPAQEDIVIAFTTTNNSALAGSDYTGQTTVSYTIPAGSTSYNIPVDVLGDFDVEPTEDFICTITLINSNNQIVSVAKDTSLGIILDEDPDISVLKTGVWNDTNNDLFAQVGETITYTFEITNTGSVPLTNVIITDPVITLSGGPIPVLAPGSTDNSTITGIHVLTQADIDAGQVINIAIGSGTDPQNNSVTDNSDDPTDLTDSDPDGDGDPDDPTIVVLPQNPKIGTAKKLVSYFTYPNGTTIANFDLKIINIGNVTLGDIQMVDTLSPMFGSFVPWTPNAPGEYTIDYLAIFNNSSDPVSVNAGYNGMTDHDIFDISSGGTLEVGDSIVVGLGILFYADKKKYLNQVIAYGDSPMNDDGIGSNDNDPEDANDKSDSGSNSSGGTNPDEPGDTGTDNDPTVLQFASDQIGGRVWDDLNANGIRDNGEPGLPSVEVLLYKCDGTLVMKDTTDADGIYYFDLTETPEDYYVVFNPVNYQSVYGFTFQDQGTNNDIDSDVNSSGIGPCITIDLFESDTSYDAGMLQLASVGNFVWHDENGDGKQTFGEQGKEGILVTLYNATTNQALQSMVTNVNGFYEFRNLMPLSYYLKFQVPVGWTVAHANQGSDVFDSDVDGTHGLGTTPTFNLTYGQDNSNWDFGLVMCSQISGDVWYDLDMDGIYDWEEKGINGLKVFIVESTTGIVVETIITATKPGTPSDDGFYRSGCLKPGTYHVEFERPGHLGASEPYKGSNPDKDSDITHENGINTTRDILLQSGDIINNMSGGFQTKSIAGDRIWIDRNFNGIQDTGEQHLSGVKIYAYNKNGVKVAEAVSVGDGSYVLDGLIQGDFYFKFELPDQKYRFTIPNNGIEEDDSDVDGTHGYGTTKTIKMISGELKPTIDAGVVSQLLALDWLSFNGAYNGNFVSLDWSTGVEFNNDYFIIERRHESESDFSATGKVDAHVKPELANHDYKFDDFNVIMSGIYYYRLKQVDKGGQYTYSNTIAVRVEGEKSNSLIFIYPNPVNDILIIDLWMPQDGELEMKVFDSNGKEVLNAPFKEYKAKGKYKETLQLSYLSAGQYVLRVKTSIGVINKKFTISR